MDFWDSWTDVTALEHERINAINKAREAVKKAVPSEALVAIYLKGSFVRRELTPTSDVDMVPVVTNDHYESSVFELNRPEHHPVCIVPLSLTELSRNRLSTPGSYPIDLRAEPDLFLLKLDSYQIIWGTPLRPEEYPRRDIATIVRDEARKIREGYLPAYATGKIAFSDLLKESFWLVEWEQRKQGHTVPHSFEGIASSIEDPEHFIHEAQAIRNGREERKQAYLEKIKAYVAHR